MCAIGFSVSVIFFADLFLPSFTARFDNYAFATVIPLAASPLLIYPMLWLLESVVQAQTALEHMARTDVLTEVANRRGFFEAAEAAFQEKRGAALMMVDIDHFKRVNDLHGHHVGDELLRQIALMIRETVREQGGMVGRLGGEEFAVLIAGASRNVAEQLAETLCRNARGLSFGHGDRALGATLSIGLAMGGVGNSVETVMKAADGAAYEAKRLGRDRWTLAAAEPSPMHPTASRAA